MALLGSIQAPPQALTVAGWAQQKSDPPLFKPGSQPEGPSPPTPGPQPSMAPIGPGLVLPGLPYPHLGSLQPAAS